MREVDPIRDVATVEGIARWLKEKSERDYIMFCIGIYSGLRISDILNLKVKDVRNKDEIRLVEKKTKKKKFFPINSILRKALDTYISGKDSEEYLIQWLHNPYKAISRVQAYNILKEAANAFGLDDIGTHTLRKTFGYHFYKQYGDVAMLMNIFNHSLEAHTLRYIGVNKPSINKSYKAFKPFNI